MSKMYEPFQIKNLTVKNRLIASPIFDYAADKGTITDRFLSRYASLTDGGAGAVFTGMIGVRPTGTISPMMVHTCYDGFVEDFKKVVDRAHENDCKILVQLNHGGYQTFNRMEGWDRFGPSDMEVPPANVPYRAMTVEEIQSVAKDFGTAAARVKETGADGIVIHAAHGYLLSSFLCPCMNHRTDEYGGDIAGRAKFLFEVYDEIRKNVGDEYVVGMKYSFNDLTPVSTTEEDSLWLCMEMEKRGMDFIEVSAGVVTTSAPPIGQGHPETPFLNYAIAAAHAVDIPVISVAGHRDPEAINKVLETTGVDAVSFGRPLIREPGLPNRWKEDPSPAKCISCNACFMGSIQCGLVTCMVEKKLQETAAK